MKLLSLTINGGYKGLSNQTFDFSGCVGNVVAFVGLNGSGKSQVLELIAETFSYLERCARSDFRVRDGFLSFSLVVKYSIRPYWEVTDEVTYKIAIDDSGHVTAERLDNDGINRQIDIQEVDLPQFVIGYASGLNENLQRSFLKNSAQFYSVMSIRAARRKRMAEEVDENELDRLNRWYINRYPGVFKAIENRDNLYESIAEVKESDTKAPSTVFLDYDCNALLTASLALLPPDELDELLPDVQHRYIHKIVIRYDLRDSAIEEDAIRDIRELVRLLGQKVLVGLSQPTTEEEYDLYELDFLHADINIEISNPEIRQRLFERYWGQPVRLFERLYKIQLLGVRAWRSEDKKSLKHDAFFGNVKKPLKTKLPLSILSLDLKNDAGQIIDFNDLSDGQAQYVQVLSACRVFREENALFLFDEPETHLNPSWRTHFHQHLSRAMGKNGEPNNRVQLFTSTHSPFLISSLDKQNVYRFERTNEGRVSMLPAATQTFGASFEVLLKRFFELDSLISQTAIDQIRMHIEQGDHAQARLWIEENIGDSMEKAYLLKRLGE